MEIKKEWISWAKKQLESLKNNGCLIYPGAAFHVDKTNKKINLYFCHSRWIGSETEKINAKVFSSIGYSYIKSDDVPKTIENTIEKFVGDVLDKSLLEAIRVVYDIDNTKLMIIMQRMGKEFSIPDTSHKFDPSKRNTLWEK
jgi:hypothetical protein